MKMTHWLYLKTKYSPFSYTSLLIVSELILLKNPLRSFILHSGFYDGKTKKLHNSVNRSKFSDFQLFSLATTHISWGIGSYTHLPISGSLKERDRAT
jgi:hypothetical protein